MSKSCGIRASLLARILVWSFRVLWISLAFTLAPAIGEALEDRSRSVQVTGTAIAWVAWGIVLLAALVPSTTMLTVVRALVPGAPLVAAVAWLHGASAGAGSIGLLAAVAATATGFAAEFGQFFVQASAYGDERRFPLRLPGPLYVLLAVAWSVSAFGLAAGALLLAAHAWFFGALLVIEGGALASFLAPRLQRLARRWLVVVPAGLVVHDPMVLAETAMIPRADVEAVALAPRRTLEIRLRTPIKITMAARPRTTPSPIETDAIVVSPSRPGYALAAATVAPPST